jgi:hypothetical protein
MEPSERPDLDPSSADHRLYVPLPEGWRAQIKQGWDKLYCFRKNPGEDYYHLILNGEIYVESADESLCLTCALRSGLVTRDRLYWQHGARPAPPPGL